jgi:hypothetical protein
MPLTTDQLRQAATRTTVYKSVRTITEAKLQGLQTVFLCHSHKDEVLVRGLISLLHDQGWKVYVDWADTTMPETPNEETARKIKEKIVESAFFMFLATANSTASRWCPWEIGYADGKKPIDKIIVIPTSNGSTVYGNEYLSLYRILDVSNTSKLAVWKPGSSTGGTLVKDL